MYYLADYVTKEKVSPGNLVFTGEKTPWEVIIDLDEVRSKINIDYFRKAPPSNSKYLPFMPIRDYSNFVSLEEGATPLIRSKHIGPKLGANLYFKIEPQNPTGSFKDRGSAVELTIAKELGAQAISVASTGNMAASCSCYAAAAKIPCFLFVPEDTPASKLSQSISYGGHIVQVKGSYNDAARLAEEVAKKLGFYLAGDYAFRVEGQKSAAFEIIDQLFFQTPDMVMVPMGCGTNITAYGKGFGEYQSLGFIDSVPRLIGVQALGASPIVKSFAQNLDTIEPFSAVSTLASAIAIGSPLDGLKALDALRESDGDAFAVDDTDTLKAQYLLSREEGLFVEASSATSIAALMKMADSESLVGKTIVCVLCGGGLKDPSSILKVAIKPPTIFPSVEEFSALYDIAFFAGSSVSFVDRNEVIFSSEPKKEEVAKYVTQFFDSTFSDDYIQRIYLSIIKFLKKGKPVIFADFQDIVQDALESLRNDNVTVFQVDDFEVNTGMDRKPVARVKVSVNEKNLEGEAEGVGPVDALVNALRLALGPQMEFSLADYKVDIRSQGTDAVVYVEMKLKKKDNTTSIGKGTSPDIIQASIEAFEEAYNGFFN